jgi:hypothetical protein
LPQDCFLAFIRIGICSEESEVMSEVKLQKFDILLVLADRLDFALKLFNGFYLHELLGNLSGCG